MRPNFKAAILVLGVAVAQLASISVAHALVVSQVIVELQLGKTVREDVELWNDSPERAYIAIEPSEIQSAGLAEETRLQEPDPEKLGLLVSPTRMVLEPGQRKLVRVAAIGSQATERVYRITMKPVVGEIQAEETGLKVLIGYDVLVLLRPAEVMPNITATRSGKALTFKNDGNVSVELIDGQQCDEAGANCAPLPGKRLYTKAEWTVDLNATGGPVEYTLKTAGEARRQRY